MSTLSFSPVRWATLHGWGSYRRDLRVRLASLGALAVSVLPMNVRKSRHTWTVSLGPGYNAWSMSEGAFMFTKALVAELPDRHLLAVIAHELGHDVLEHTPQRTVRLVVVLLGSGLLGWATRSMGVFLSFLGLGGVCDTTQSRGEELRADRLALQILRGLGYGRREILEVLAWLRDRVGDTPGTIFDTHPSLSERMAHLLSATEE